VGGAAINDLIAALVLSPLPFGPLCTIPSFATAKILEAISLRGGWRSGLPPASAAGPIIGTEFPRRCAMALPEFHNEPLTDFSTDAGRTAMQQECIFVGVR